MRHYTVLFFFPSSMEDSYLMRFNCNVRSQLLAAQSGGEGPEFSSNASFITLRQANTTPERTDLSATSLRTYLDSDGRSEPQPKQNSIAKPDRAGRAASYSTFPGNIKMRGGICDAILTLTGVTQSKIGDVYSAKRAKRAELTL